MCVLLGVTRYEATMNRKSMQQYDYQHHHHPVRVSHSLLAVQFEHTHRLPLASSARVASWGWRCTRHIYVSATTVSCLSRKGEKRRTSVHLIIKLARVKEKWRRNAHKQENLLQNISLEQQSPLKKEEKKERVLTDPPAF